MYKDDNERLIAGALSTNPFSSTIEVTGESAPPSTEPAPAAPLDVGVADFFGTCTDSINYLLHPFVIEGGFVLVIGPPKSGKTWFVAWLAAQVASAGKGKVFFVEEEGSKEVLRDRLKPFLAPDPTAYNDNLRIVFRENVKIDQPRWVERLSKDCIGASMIVLDPFAAIHGRDENEQSQMGPVLNAIQALSKHTGATIVLVHHTKKGASWDKSSSEETSTADVRGSGAVVAAVDSVIAIRSVRSDKRVAGQVRFFVENPDTRVGAPFERKLACVDLTAGVGTLQWLDEEAESPSETVEELLTRVLLLLPSGPDRPLSQEKLREGLRVKKDRMRKAVQLGRERKLIESTHWGLYKPASTNVPTDSDPDSDRN